MKEVERKINFIIDHKPQQVVSRDLLFSLVSSKLFEPQAHQTELPLKDLIQSEALAFRVLSETPES